MTDFEPQAFEPRPFEPQPWAGAYGTAMVHDQTPEPRLEPAALLTLSLGVASAVVWIIPAVVALFLAPGAKRNVEASGSLRYGIGLARAGQLISVATLVGVVVVAAWIGLSGE